MISALWTGISGLSTQQKALDNEAHNISNVNTVGYKASRISFADQLYQDKIGKGSKVLDAEKIFTQGGRKLTGVAYDLALNGEGFFAVSNKSEAGTSETFYTRAGNFRMGDNGTLQDAQGNEVQGWAMRPIDEQKDVTTTNPDSSVFTDDYNKLLSSKVIKHSTYIETITAKATEYDETAVKDAELIFGGAGAKSKAAKVSDVEELVKAYTTALQRLQEDPDGLSSTSTPQVSQLNFKGDTLKKDGDQIYVYINGNKISQGFVSVVADPTLLASEVGDLTKDGTLTVEDADLAASRIATYKALADKISEIPGFKATTISNGTNYDATDDTTYYANNFSLNDIFKNSTKDLDVLHGMIQITSLIPGDSFVIKEHAEVSGNQVTQGSLNNSGSQTDSLKGTGLGDVESIKDALIDAVSGKQRDVFTPSDLGILYNSGTGLITSPTEFDYSISIYDKDLQKNLTIDASFSPLSTSVIGTPLENVLDDIASKINNDINLKEYIKANVINGNIVIETLNKNSDVEFSGTLNGLKTTYSPVALNSVTSTSATATDSTPNLGAIDTSIVDINTLNYPTAPSTATFNFTFNDGGSPVNVTVTGAYSTPALLTAAIAADATFIASSASIAEAGGLITLSATDNTTIISGGSLSNNTITEVSGAAVDAGVGIGATSTFTIPPTITYPITGTFNLEYNDGSARNITLTGPFIDQDALGAAIVSDAPTFGATAGYTSGTGVIVLTATGVAGVTVGKITAVAAAAATTPSTDLSNAGQIDTSMVAIPSGLVYPLPATGTGNSYTFNYNDNGTAQSISLTGPYTAEVDLVNDIISQVNTLSGAGTATAVGGTITLSSPNIIDTMSSGQLIVVAPGNTAGIDGTNSITVNGVNATQGNPLTKDTADITLPIVGVTYPVLSAVFSYNDGTLRTQTLSGPFANKDEIGNAMASAANSITGGSANYDKTTGKLSLKAGTDAGDMKDSSVIIDAADKSEIDLASFTFPLTSNDTIELTFSDNGTPQNVQINPSNFADADALGAAIALLGGSKITYDSLSKKITMLADNSTDSMTTSKLVITNNTITTAPGILDKNADYSGRQGAGGEFIEIVTRIDQTTTQDSLQLRLDSLGISDSAFGEFSVDDTGLVTMKQDGAEFAIGQVAIAKFNNMRGLDAIGDNLYAKTNNSGDAIFNINNNKTATIESASLELSTADLSESLVNLMVFQRAFEANAKSITTADQLLTTLIQLKR